MNTILLALTGLVSALTPIILLFMNNRQATEAVSKANRLEELHREVMNKTVPVDLTIHKNDGAPIEISK